MDTLETLQKGVVIAYGGNRQLDSIKTIPQLRSCILSYISDDNVCTGVLVCGVSKTCFL